MQPIATSGERRATLAELEVEARRAAAAMAAAGVEEGDSVALCWRNDLPFISAAEAASLIGAYSVPVNWHFTAEETGYILADCGAKVVLVHSDLWPRIREVVPAGVEVVLVETPAEIRRAYDLPDEDPADPEGRPRWDDWVAAHGAWAAEEGVTRGSMIYTSGTTGRPKGVRREPATPEQQQNTLAMASSGFGVRPGVVGAITGPLYHSAPMAYMRLLYGMGCDIHLLPRFDAAGLLADIERLGLSHMHMVPTMFVRLLALPKEARAAHDLSSLECVIHGAAPCPIPVKERMIAWWGPVIREYYGSTEAGLVTISTSEQFLAKPGTVGVPREGTRLRILDAEGRDVARGEEGEIYMSIDMLTDFTYHNRDAERAEIERDGLVTNGDIGYLDEDGYLFLRDRRRDMIISGGVNIYPAEIESALIEMPEVRDCAVFGIPHEEFGESVAAAITLVEGATANLESVRAYLAGHIAAYKLPRKLDVLDDLPREDSGKIFKRKLREPYWRDVGRRI